MYFKILFTGNYDPNYNRTKIIKNGILKLGHEIIELPFKEKNNEIKNKIIKISNKVDFIFLPSFTHKFVPFIRKTIPDKTLIFDPLISNYMTMVFDYKKYHKYSINAFLKFYQDKKALTNSDIIITDTLAHLEYYNQKYKIPKSRMRVIYIGNNFDIFYPLEIEKNTDKFIVGFYGGFNPLQGTLNIVKAAELLKYRKEIIFNIIGNGFEYKKTKEYVDNNKIKNVNFINNLPENELAVEINKFDIALGIFGESIKTEMVIPNKIYHYASCKKAIITKNTKAIKELFFHMEDIYLSNNDPLSISKAIIYLKENKDFAKNLAERAYKKVRDNYNEISVAKKFINILLDTKIY